MATDSFKVKKSLNIDPSAAAGSSPAAGDLRVDSADSNKLKYHNGTDEKQVIREDQLADLVFDNTGMVYAAGTDPQTAIGQLDTALDDHADTAATAAHTAANIEVTPSGNLAATDAQAALQELQSDIDTRATSTDLTNHLNDTTDAHDASAISVTPTGNLAADDVQEALTELQGDIDNIHTGTSVGVGTSNTATTINIGTGTDTNTINIGGANTTINMTGTVNNQNVTNLDIDDKLITINKGGAASSGAVAGIDLEEGGSSTGYIKTSADRNSWEIKAPNTAGVISVTPGASGGTVGLVPTSGVVKSNGSVLSSSNVNLASEVTGTLPIANGGTGQTTANAALNALLPSQTGANNKVLKSNGTDTSWAVAGSGGGAKNYLGTVNGTDNGGDFEGNTVGSWVLGNASLTSAFPSGSPTFGSGASGNLTGSVTSSSPLSGSYSYSYASSAATTAGNFLASPAFTIDISDQAKVMTFKFAYKTTSNPSNANWSGTSSNSFGVAIYDVTNSAWIMPAGVWGMTQSSGVGICTGTFQTTSDSTQYRLVVFNANATSGAVTLYFDDFFLGPQTAPIGAVVADLGTETWTDNQANSTTSVKLQRVGNRVFVDGTVTFTGAMSGAFTLTIPSAYTPAYGTTGSIVQGAKVSLIDTGTATFQGQAFWTATNTLTIYVVGASGTYANYVDLSATVPHTWTNGDFIRFSADWEVTGWGSNVQMSNDTDTRVVAFSTYRATNQTGVNPNNSAVKVTIDTVTADTHAAFSTANNRYVAPVSGYYDFSAAITFSGTNVLANEYYLGFYKNGSAVVYPGWYRASAGTSFLLTGNSGPIYLNAGDYVELYVFGVGNNSASTLTVAGGSTNTWFSGKRLSGPAVVAATESVNARYTNTAGTSIANSLADVNVPFATKDFDSHNAYNTSTGVYTVPVSGKFRVTATMAYASSAWTAGNSAYASVYKNSAAHSYGAYQMLQATVTLVLGLQVTAIVSCNAGDTLEIRAANNRTGGNTSLSTTAGINHFEIERIGN